MNISYRTGQPRKISWRAFKPGNRSPDLRGLYLAGGAVLARLARHPLLVFIDADVRLATDALVRLAGFMEQNHVALASGVPRQTLGTISEKLLIPLIHFILLGFLPMRTMRRTRSPAFSAGCGQLFVARRWTYPCSGGHPELRDSLHDGIKLPRVFRRAGFSTDLFDATDVATCRMYHTNHEMWRGLGRNATEGLAAPATIIPMTALLVFGQVMPFVLLLLAAPGSWAFYFSSIGGGLALIPRVVAAQRFQQSWLGALLHPVGVLLLLGIQWHALLKQVSGRPMRWKDRSYSPGKAYSKSSATRVSAARLSLLVVCLGLLSGAHVQADSTPAEVQATNLFCPQFKLADQFGTTHSVAFPRPQPMILVVADKQGSEQMEAWVTAGSEQNNLAADDHWVTTWGTAPQLTETGNLPPVPLANRTLRQFVRVSIGGKHLRMRFSNNYGTNAVFIKAANLALATSTASSGNGDIITNTIKELKFRGAPGVVIPAGELSFSDPVAFDLSALTNVAISIYFGRISASTINGHPGSRTTSFIKPGNMISAANLSGASTTKHWYIINGIEVLADSSSKAIAILGDSITDGRGSTDDGNNRWPDLLAERLATNALTAGVGVVNLGIGGNAIFGGLGPAAVNRFDRDILGQSGARYFILFEGVNDIGSGSSSMATATNLVNAFTQMAAKAKAHGMRAYGATITPFGGNGYYTDLHEHERQFVNAWIRTNTVFDGVIDFDAAVRDPAAPTKFKAEYYPGVNANDWLHMNPLGYQAMADAIDLSLFTP